MNCNLGLGQLSQAGIAQASNTHQGRGEQPANLSQNAGRGVSVPSELPAAVVPRQEDTAPGAIRDELPAVVGPPTIVVPSVVVVALIPGTSVVLLS